MAGMDKLTNEQKELQKTFQNVSGKSLNVTKNVFKSLKEVSGMPENFLKMLIFGTSVGMLYLGLILTAWDIKIELVNSARDEADQSTSQRETAATQELTPATDYPESSPSMPSAEDRADLLAYVNAAVRSTGKLNGNERVAEQTGISLARCFELRRYLMELSIDGKSVINVKQGCGEANLPKERIIGYLQDQTPLAM